MTDRNEKIDTFKVLGAGRSKRGRYFLAGFGLGEYMRYIIYLLLSLTMLFAQNELTRPKTSVKRTPTSSQSQVIKDYQQRLNNQIDELIKQKQLQMKKDSVIRALKDSLKKDEHYWDEYEKNKDSYSTAVFVFTVVMCLWFFVMTILLFWGLNRFHFTAGLGKEKYAELVAIIDHDEEIPIHERQDYYPKNPYQNESFGLPKGTIRGFLTLTLLVMNCFVIYMSLFAPPGRLYDDRIEYLTTAFLMMIAFYFGSRAVDVFKSQGKNTQGAS